MASGACLAACSAGSAVGGGGDSPGSGASNATGGKGGTGSGGSGASATGGSSGTGAGGGTSGGTSGSSGSSGSSGTSGSGGSSMTTSCPSSQIGSPALRLLTRREIDNTLDDIFPSVKGKWTDSLPANITVASGFDNDVSAVVGNQLASALFDTALSVATAVTGSGFQNVLPCAGTTKDHACAKTFLDTTGKLLFRRALTDTEENRYLMLFDQGLAAADFPTAMKWVIAGLIQSPNVVYRSELGTGTGTRTLTGSEIATELAYTFGGSTPSADLIDEFASGPPPSADTLASTAASLLQTDKGKLAFQHFFAQYLTYEGTAGITRTLTDPPPQVPYASVAADMLAETQTFIDKVVLAGGSLSDLLTSNKTYPTSTLAGYYGLPAPGADGSVTRPSGQGVGVLAQGSFLSTHANSDYSSPTQRGLFVYYRLLCQPKLSPPNGMAPPFTTSETSAATTTRQLYETAHMTNSTCKGCHAQFDPVGFGFENFDQGGRYRTQQNAQNVDTTGSARLADGTTLFSFENEEDLMQQLASRPEVAQCFSAYLSTYAFGTSAACLGASNAQGLADGSLSIVQAFANLAREPSFTERVAP
jgi:hypothetical protein